MKACVITGYDSLTLKGGMHTRRLMSFLVACFVLISLFSLSLSTARAQENQTTQLDKFQVQSDSYFLQRSYEFEEELALKESFLVWLYQGIIAEASNRRKEDLNSTLSAFEPLDLSIFEDTTFAVSADLEEAPLRIKYSAWEDAQRKKYNYKYTAARRIKDRLLESANSNQLLRMFRRDLEAALMTYRDGLFVEAVPQFNEVIERYGYQDIEDIIYYRAESYFAMTMINQAEEDYKYVVEKTSDPALRRKALERLIAINGDKGNIPDLTALKNTYNEEVPEADRGSRYWQTMDIIARYYMTHSEFDLAQEILDQIPSDSDFYIEAKLLSADCSLAELDLEEGRQRYLEIAQGEFKKSQKPKKLQRATARLKLGYIDYLEGNFYEAYNNFTMVTGAPELEEKAIIAASWSMFRVHDYAMTVKMTREFLVEYPETGYFYEALCLIGYCEEVLGNQDVAMTDYTQVMEAEDDRAQYQDFNVERNSIARSIGDLQRIEPTLFLSGRRELFDRYDTLRRKLKALYERIRLTEGIRANKKISGLLDEQKELYRVYDELTKIEDELFNSNDVKMVRQYEDVHEKLIEMALDLQSGIKYNVQDKTLVQREVQQSFDSRLSDSLTVRYNAELESARDALKQVRELMGEAERMGDDALLVELGEVELGLMGLQSNLFSVKWELGNKEFDAESSFLDWWSWYAYSRYTTAGLDMDNLYVKETRLNNIEDYINRINDIITERRGEEVELVELPENLVPTSLPGEEPYKAPPIPLWQSMVEEVIIDTSTVIEEQFDMEPDSLKLEEEMMEEGLDEDIDVGEEEIIDDELDLMEEDAGADEADEIEEQIEDDGQPEEPEDGETGDVIEEDAPEDTVDEEMIEEPGEEIDEETASPEMIEDEETDDQPVGEEVESDGEQIEEDSEAIQEDAEAGEETVTEETASEETEVIEADEPEAESDEIPEESVNPDETEENDDPVIDETEEAPASDDQEETIESGESDEEPEIQNPESDIPENEESESNRQDEVTK